MAGYVKRIAVIKTVKQGFSADGGELSGLIKCETYAGFLKAEASLINFSPLSEGRYCTGLSDGNSVVSFDGPELEVQTDFDISRGFAALVCFCNNGVFPVASAVCGDLEGELARIHRKLAQEESAPKREDSQTAFDDEAISEVNYYELEAAENGGAVCEDKAQEKNGRTGVEDEEDFGVIEKEREGAAGLSREEVGSLPPNGEYATADGNLRKTAYKDVRSGLAGGDFYNKIKDDVKKIFSTYPSEAGLEGVIQGSRWARIGYGNGKFYAFGVIYDGGEAKYICYAVPSADSSAPPRSLAGRASFIPVEDGGFWVMYQDADTGASIKISAE